MSPQVGDPQELNGIDRALCATRQDPLLIGSTKSNMGHPEPASGLAALAKVGTPAGRAYGYCARSLLWLTGFPQACSSGDWECDTTTGLLGVQAHSPGRSLPG